MDDATTPIERRSPRGLDRVRARTHRVSALTVALLTLLATLLPVAAVPASADAGLEADLVTRVNQARAAAGLPALRPTDDLVAAARRHAGVMADTQHLHHNPRLAHAVDGWRKLGENVGRGPEIARLHEAFMASPSHARNVLDGGFTQIGIGIVVRDGTIWVTQMFRTPDGPPSGAPAPTSTPDTSEAAARAEPVGPAESVGQVDDADTSAETPGTQPVAADAARSGPAAADAEPDAQAADAGAADAGGATGAVGSPRGEQTVRLVVTQLRLASREGAPTDR